MAVRTRAPRRKTYHHGNLREALIEAAEKMVEADGAETVTVREAARRAGVSPGAPFRHFTSRTALLTAVAEKAMQKLWLEIEAALEPVPDDEPLLRFAALGRAYVRFAVRNPTLLRVITNRRVVDFEGSSTLARDTDAIRLRMSEFLRDARARGQLRDGDLALYEFASRAFAYGLVRTYVDDHFPQWGLPGEKPERALHRGLDLFIELLSKPKPKTKPRRR